MEVDSKEEQPQAQQQQASSSEQALPEQTSSNNNNKMETEDGNEGSDSKDGKSDKKQARDKRKITRPLVIIGKYLNEISNEIFKEWMELECQLSNTDRVIHETAEKRNELESFVYTLRNKLEAEYNDYVTIEAKEKYLIHLDEIQTWIYDEGDHAQKSNFIDKLKDLHAISDPIASKHWEWTHRPQRIENLKKLINRYLKFVDSQEEIYLHIEIEEKDKVRKIANEYDTWLFEEQQKQDKISKIDAPSFTCSQIDLKYRELMNLCEPIMTKPKPKPKPQEPTPTPNANATPNATPDANANANANVDPNANIDPNANANANDASNNNQSVPEEKSENDQPSQNNNVDPMEVE